MEGNHCFKPKVGCDTRGLQKPIHEYGRKDGGSVTGGYVYRGQRLRSLVGAYIYSDFLTGNIWALWRRASGTENKLLLNTGKNIASFGTDGRGELYVLAFDGHIYQLVPKKD